MNLYFSTFMMWVMFFKKLWVKGTISFRIRNNKLKSVTQYTLCVFVWLIGNYILFKVKKNTKEITFLLIYSWNNLFYFMVQCWTGNMPANSGRENYSAEQIPRHRSANVCPIFEQIPLLHLFAQVILGKLVFSEFSTSLKKTEPSGHFGVRHYWIFFLSTG